MLFLSKLIPVFLFPLGFAILLGLASLLLPRRWRISRLLIGVAVVVLWVASTPVVANWLSASLESAYPPIPVERLPQADVAIVLGGVLSPEVPLHAEPDLGDPVDRIIEAWRLYRAGKVDTILVSGGNLPWVAATEPEAVLIKRFLVELGVPGSAIVVETDSRNTRENAVNVAAILGSRGWRSALLVTSGMHMPRAVAAFRRVAVSAVPAPTDLHSHSGFADGPLDFLPDSHALAATTFAIKEWLGLLYYRLRGWA